MKTFWSVVFVLFLIVLVVVAAWVNILIARAAFQLPKLESRVALLESHATALEWRLQSSEEKVSELETFNKAFCGTILRLSEVDMDLIAAGAVEIPGKSEPLFDKVFSAQAYCQGIVFVSIDVRQTPGSKIIFQNTEVTSHLRSGVFPGGDFEIVLVNERGSVSANLGGFVERGDLVKVWVSSEKPEIAAFYDEATGLAISILHIDGSVELFVYD